MARTDIFTVVGVFRGSDQARDALRALTRAGFSAADAAVLAPDREQTKTLAEDTGSTASAEAPTEMGIPQADAAWYERELRGGGTLVAVRAGARVDEAQEVLRQHGAYNVSAHNPSGTAEVGTQGKRVIELREEELVAHKGVEETGEVEIRKEVVTETRKIEVPVTRERLVVHTTGKADVRVEGEGSGGGGAAATLRKAWRGTRQRVPMGAASGSLALLGTAAGGAWLYRRWQQERNRPLNRLRRRARRISSRLSDGVPDSRDLQRYIRQADITPTTGVGAFLLVLSLLAGSRWRGRAARRPPAEEPLPATPVYAAPAWLGPTLDQVRQRWILVQPLAGRMSSAAMMARLQALEAARARRASAARPDPAVVPLLAVGTAGFLVWRMIRGRRGAGGPDYIGTPGVESAGGRDRTQTGELPPEMGREHPE